MFCIVAAWDGSNRISRYNYVDTEVEAQRLVNRLRGSKPSAERVAEMQAVIDDPDESIGNRFWAWKEQFPLPLAKQAADAYYAEMPAIPAGYKGYAHRARFWIADPVNKAVSFDVMACHGWQKKLCKKAIKSDADQRVKDAMPEEVRETLQARGLELQDKGRPNWSAAEKKEWDSGMASWDSVKAIRTAAQVLNDSLDNKTADEIRAVIVSDPIHWPQLTAI